MNQTLKIKPDFKLPWETFSIHRNIYGEWHFKTKETKLGTVHIIADSHEELVRRIHIEAKKAIRKISKRVKQ